MQKKSQRVVMELGYDEAARICLTHSFSKPDIHVYIGNFDITEEEQKIVEDALAEVTYDEYDKLIQLCDCLASAEGVVDIEKRMEDVKNRYGSYPQEKWDANMGLLQYFSEKAGQDIYQVVE